LGTLRKLVQAAARVAGDESIVPLLVASTGLSRENVKLGLSDHLEVDATDEELEALGSSATPEPRVHVILSASVFVAPLRAIALALAASDCVTVKPSRREPCFARALVTELGDPRVTLTPDLRPEDVPKGTIHVYGLDETIGRMRARARAGVSVRGHGNGMGIALVTGDAESAAQALARDVVAFDQRGCSSPRAVFVVGDAATFARRLFDALEVRGKDVPRGALDRGEAQDFARWASTLEYAGTLHRGESCSVGVIAQSLFPPTGRHVLVYPIASPDDLPRALDRYARFIITVGSDAPDVARTVAPPHARVCALGAMQRPPLDGPIDRR
jgi:hypothetical protein